MLFFACPVCHEPLEAIINQFRCVNGHHFDRAKEGYINLLLANQKKSHDPGDNRVMIQARRRFLDAGYYRSLLDTVNAMMIHVSADAVALDIGCGEGYYIGQLDQKLCFGVDISKDAIRYAAKRYTEVEFAVASVKRLPVLDQSVDLALNIFAPLDVPEIIRIIRPNGIVIKIRPGEKHLFELRKLLYEQPQMHDASAMAGLDGLTQIRSEKLCYSVQITRPDHIQDLMQMTPYYWHVTEEKHDLVKNLEQIHITVDFQIDVYQMS